MRAVSFIFVAILLPLAAATQELEGLWVGTIQADTVTLRLVLHVNRSPQGLTGTLDSVDQGSAGLPFTSLTQNGPSVKFALDRIAASFEGTLAENDITGAWKQGGLSVPLVFKRTDRLPEIARPQDPKKPYPYHEEEVSYLNSKAGIRLAGTLTLPRAAGPSPGVLLISGSGPQDRNGTLFGHKPFLILADYLTRRGIAVLRVDDRGAGSSGGKPDEGVSTDFVGDTLAGVAFLKSRKEIDARRIGLVGNSVGGLIAALATAQCADIAFLVMMAAPGVSGERLLEFQAEDLLKGMGAPAEILARNRALQHLAFDIFRQEKDDDAAFRKIREAASTMPGAGALLPLLETQLKGTNMPRLRELLVYDPRPTFAKVTAPVLAIHGERDVEAPARASLPSIAEALESGGNHDYAMVKLPGLNHLFQTSTTGSRSEYSKIEETIAPAALEAVAGWIASHTRRQP